jgi:hypothetical protein
MYICDLLARRRLHDKLSLAPPYNVLPFGFQKRMVVSGRYLVKIEVNDTYDLNDNLLELENELATQSQKSYFVTCKIGCQLQ